MQYETAGEDHPFSFEKTREENLWGILEDQVPGQLVRGSRSITAYHSARPPTSGSETNITLN